MAELTRNVELGSVYCPVCERRVRVEAAAIVADVGDSGPGPRQLTIRGLGRAFDDHRFAVTADRGVVKVLITGRYCPFSAKPRQRA